MDIPEPQALLPAWYREPCMMGIDEAGRGPVLGAMVYACAYCPIATAGNLKKRKFADSKTLNERARETLYEDICEDPELGHSTEIQTAEFISNNMLARDRVSLNQLAINSTISLIEKVIKIGVELKEVYVDTVGDAGRYQERLSECFPSLHFVVCPKADAIYPVVSAASIVAKVTRDRLLRHFQHPELLQNDCNFGSGYPADPDTKFWLDKQCHPIFGFPSLVRFSWSTCAPLLESRGVKVFWECEETSRQPNLSFKIKEGNRCIEAVSQGSGRHSYFRARKLQRVHGGL